MNDSSTRNIVSLGATILESEPFTTALNQLYRELGVCDSPGLIKKPWVTLTFPAYIDCVHNKALIEGSSLAQHIAGHPLFSEAFTLGHPEIRSTSLGDVLYVPVQLIEGIDKHSALGEYLNALRRAITDQYGGAWLDLIDPEVFMCIDLVRFLHAAAPAAFSDKVHSYEIPSQLSFKLGRVDAMLCSEAGWSVLDNEVLINAHLYEQTFDHQMDIN